MKNKEFAVFGLGKFGRSVAETLAESGCEVLAVDKDEETVQDIADKVTYAAKADATDKDALQTLGVSNLDAAVVAIAENMEVSILVTIYLKELGVPYVIVKAQSEIHASILKKVGADDIIFPEREMGARIARNLISGNFIDYVELSSKISMAEIEVPVEWVGKSLRDLNIRDKYSINVVGIKDGDDIEVNINPGRLLKSGEIMILIGDNSSLQKLTR